MTLSNSTVVFNKSYGSNAAVSELPPPHSHFKSASLPAIAVQLALPTSRDLVLPPLNGANNLIIASTMLLPPDTIQVDDPKLGPLQFNAGITQTHALLTGSPAIGKGNNAANQAFAQRGAGYPRTLGANQTTDIGAFSSTRSLLTFRLNRIPQSL